VVLMTKILKSILPVVALFAVTINGQAVEYVTLTDNTKNLDVLPSSVVEVVGGLPNSNTSYSQTLFTFADGTSASIHGGFIGQIYTGLTHITYGPGSTTGGMVSFKITKANELNVVSPTSLLVLPENSNGDYDVLLETSSDAGTWSPFLSQTVSAADAKRFFRARIVKKN
jgi:hypothetical protein